MNCSYHSGRAITRGAPSVECRPAAFLFGCSLRPQWPTAVHPSIRRSTVDSRHSRSRLATGQTAPPQSVVAVLCDASPPSAVVRFGVRVRNDDDDDDDLGYRFGIRQRALLRQPPSASVRNKLPSLLILLFTLYNNIFADRDLLAIFRP